ncbi:hypothetical protein SMICM304S_11064 [Streptomyces microflavus]
MPWQRFLDEVAEAGYAWIDLGPYGYLPTDPARLKDETRSRGLTVSAGTVFTGLHHGPDVWDRTWAHVADIAELTRAMGAEHLVVIPSFWRDDKTGEVLEDRTLTPAQWRDLASQTERAAQRGHRTGTGSASSSTRSRHPGRPRRTATASSTPPPPPLPVALARTPSTAALPRRQRQAHRDRRGAQRLPPPQAGRRRCRAAGGGGRIRPYGPASPAGVAVRTARRETPP